MTTPIEEPEHRPLDPSDPIDRRVQIVMKDLRTTADDLGPHGVDALRYRMSLPDAEQTARWVANATRDRTPWVPPEVPEPSVIPDDDDADPAGGANATPEPDDDPAGGRNRPPAPEPDDEPAPEPDEEPDQHPDDDQADNDA